MNELIKINDGKLEEYEKLLLEKEELLRECEQLMVQYLRIFGEKMKERFYLKIECIRRKKMIAYCERFASRGLSVDGTELDAFIERQMKTYNDSLQGLYESVETSKNAVRISEHTILKLKKTYRRIMRLIHPDMNPQFKNDEKLLELFNRVTIAYRISDLNEMEELEGLVNAYLKTKGYEYTPEIDDLDTKISRLSREIDEIRNKEPYQYRFLLEDEEAVEEENRTLDHEIANYRNYSARLDELLNGYRIERRLS